MTMQGGEEERKWKELHCANCGKYMGFVNDRHQHFPNDFCCSLKCTADLVTKQKEKDKITEQTLK